MKFTTAATFATFALATSYQTSAASVACGECLKANFEGAQLPYSNLPFSLGGSEVLPLGTGQLDFSTTANAADVAADVLAKVQDIVDKVLEQVGGAVDVNLDNIQDLIDNVLEQVAANNGELAELIKRILEKVEIPQQLLDLLGITQETQNAVAAMQAPENVCKYSANNLFYLQGVKNCETACATDLDAQTVQQINQSVDKLKELVTSSTGGCANTVAYNVDVGNIIEQCTQIGACVTRKLGELKDQLEAGSCDAVQAFVDDIKVCVQGCVDASTSNTIAQSQCNTFSASIVGAQCASQTSSMCTSAFSTTQNPTNPASPGQGGQVGSGTGSGTVAAPELVAALVSAAVLANVARGEAF